MMSESAKATVFFVMWVSVTFARSRLTHPYEWSWFVGIIIAGVLSATCGVFLYRQYLVSHDGSGK